MVTFARVVLWVSALSFAGIGVAALVAPAATVAGAGLGPLPEPARAGLTEIRAMYGGLELGLAAFLAWCTLAPERLPTGLLATVLTLGGLGAARLLGIAVDQPDGWQMPAFAVIELSGAVAAGVAWTRLR